MIDREARDTLAQAIRALGAGTISNDAFERRRQPALGSADPAVAAIDREGAWQLYDDFQEHRLRGRYALTRGGRSEVARWVLFLKTDLPYEWPLLRGPGLFLLGLANLLTLGIAGRGYAGWFGRQGDIDVWPFVRQADYAAALERAAYLGGGNESAGNAS